MTFDKSKYIKLTFNGYSWCMFNKGIHTFSKKVAGGYASVECSEEQLTNGDIEFMTENGITIDHELKSNIQFCWTRENP